MLKLIQKSVLSNLVWSNVVALLFLSLGHTLILQRSLEGPTESLRIRGDSDAYILMVEGNWSTVESPFRFRVLAPLLASVIPFTPTESLRIVSYFSLFVSYVLIILTCIRAGLNIAESIVGLLSVWVSTRHLYNFQNPFLTDALGILMICAMIYALVSDNFFLFVVAAFLGVFTRETTLFLVPLWATRGLRQGVVLTLGCLIAWLILYYALGSEGTMTLASAFGKSGAYYLEHPIIYVKTIFSSWSYLWFLPLIGMWYLPVEKFIPLAGSFVVLLLGAFITAMVATDYGRMFSILTPVFAITCSQLTAVIVGKKPALLFFWLSLLLVQAFTSQPNILFAEDSLVVSRNAEYAIAFIGIAFSVSLLVVLRESLKGEFQGKMLYLRAIGIGPFARKK